MAIKNSHVGYPQRPEKPEQEQPSSARTVHHRYPEDAHIPIVPRPEPEDEVGVAGGPVEELVSEFSWADRNGVEGKSNAPGRDRDGNPIPRGPRLVEELEQEPHKPLGLGLPDHPEEHKANPLRNTSFLLDH